MILIYNVIKILYNFLIKYNLSLKCFNCLKLLSNNQYGFRVGHNSRMFLELATCTMNDLNKGGKSVYFLILYNFSIPFTILLYVLWDCRIH